jgi:hypothetical protein
MDIELVKHELINWIADLDDENLLMKVDSLRTKNSGDWHKLSEEDRLAVEEGLLQLNEGKYISYAEARKRINTKLIL